MIYGFIRHIISRSDPQIQKKILEELWDNNSIAIHYEDLVSTNGDDYEKKSAKQAINQLKEFCEFGAIIGADFSKLDPTYMLVGKIEPKSKIEVKLIEGKSLKSVKLKNSIKISYFDFPLLSAIKPRRTTICKWKHESVHRYLDAIINGNKVPWNVFSLDPNQLEIICFEYLKLENKIEVLLLPIGRNLPDIDIIGLDNQENQIMAQVTNTTSDIEIKKKLDRLNAFKTKTSKLYFFGPKSKKDSVNNKDIEYLSNELVFERLTKEPKAIQYKMICRMLHYE